MIPKKALCSLVTSLTGLQAVWITDPWPNLGAQPGGIQAYVVLSATALAKLGIDQYRQQVDAQGHPTASAIVGNRNVTISMRCTSIDPQNEAFDLLDILRSKLWSFTTLKWKAANNVAIVRCPSLTPLPKSTLDNRAASVAVLDVVFALAANVVVTDDDGATIDTVNEGGPIAGTIEP